MTEIMRHEAGEKDMGGMFQHFVNIKKYFKIH